jgi:hypothetical protein
MSPRDKGCREEIRNVGEGYFIPLSARRVRVFIPCLDVLSLRFLTLVRQTGSRCGAGRLQNNPSTSLLPTAPYWQAEAASAEQ